MVSRSLLPPSANRCQNSRRPRWLTALLLPALLGLVVGCNEDTQSPTGPIDPAPEASVAHATAALSFSQVSVGSLHSCGVTTDNLAYCWGMNNHGQLGTGTATGPETCSLGEACSTRPVAVTGGLRFRQVSVGSEHSCGVTTTDRAYCWGSNGGKLGDGTPGTRHRPVLVGGGRGFRQVAAGTFHTCAVNPFNRIFCWGNNNWGQLGDGTTTDRLTPVRVPGTQLFSQVTAAQLHTCGITTANRAYCWGDNANGQLGDRTRIQRRAPVAVFGGLSFRNLSAGGWHTCGVTTGSRAYCWGRNASGQIGDNSDYPRRLRPTAVVGGLTFRTVDAGLNKTCGLTADDRAYCWGSEGGRTPAAVEGGPRFAQLDVGDHRCGVTPSNAAYCWGWNHMGQLGDGTRTDRTRPTPVASPS